ncbi:hypothetical protein NDU88_003153 [Pleurodeles waltl]|uniref:Uncharacterized protein n=1 Tax=Pleurodeles waltl TaxID=8319 RepID=A0AAV7KUU0_PLEWA|nr:hypothetical protein NDU88_003153 [Pleurodeles waltl]
MPRRVPRCGGEKRFSSAARPHFLSGKTVQQGLLEYVVPPQQVVENVKWQCQSALHCGAENRFSSAGPDGGRSPSPGGECQMAESVLR